MRAARGPAVLTSRAGSAGGPKPGRASFSGELSGSSHLIECLFLCRLEKLQNGSRFVKNGLMIAQIIEFICCKSASDYHTLAIRRRCFDHQQTADLHAGIIGSGKRTYHAGSTDGLEVIRFGLRLVEIR